MRGVRRAQRIRATFRNRGRKLGRQRWRTTALAKEPKLDGLLAAPAPGQGWPADLSKNLGSCRLSRKDEP